VTEISPIHLIERAAARLRGEAGLSSLGGASLAAPPTGEEDTSVERSARAAPVDAAADAIPAPATHDQIMLDRTALERAGLVPAAERRSRIAEELRIAAGNVLRAVRAGPAGSALSPPANMVMVTSARPGEGKSFLSLNLAATLAEQGVARVLLVDLDPKPKALTALLGLLGRPGLADLGGDPALKTEALAARTAIRDLSVLPIGTRAAGEHGLTRKLAAALERLSRRHAGQLVIIDSPPCLATSEAASLAPMVGLIALVVEAEQTQREELERSVELLKACPNMILLLNKLRDTTGNDFGGYDYYGV
jgi:receptor protein-tyrosine kinase